ncbi:hypothetical protein BaRGS_00010539, partial [Batillaria attramentaria]
MWRNGCAYVSELGRQRTGLGGEGLGLRERPYKEKRSLSRHNHFMRLGSKGTAGTTHSPMSTALKQKEMQSHELTVWLFCQLVSPPDLLSPKTPVRDMDTKRQTGCSHVTRKRVACLLPGRHKQSVYVG